MELLGILSDNCCLHSRLQIGPGSVSDWKLMPMQLLLGQDCGVVAVILVLQTKRPVRRIAIVIWPNFHWRARGILHTSFTDSATGKIRQLEFGTAPADPEKFVLSKW